MLDKQKDKFINKVFTLNESEYCFSKANPAIHLAGRFAAKESIKKCLYSSTVTSAIEFNQIEVLSRDNGAPYISKIKDLAIKEIQISISHETDFAIAMAAILL